MLSTAPLPVDASGEGGHMGDSNCQHLTLGFPLYEIEL